MDVAPRIAASPGLRLGRHHFAHLRAVAEGVTVPEAAKRYLAVEHGNAAGAAHRAIVERVRALARRRGDSRWRLIGVDLRDASRAPLLPDAAPPSIDEWAARQGLTEWSHDDLQALYAEQCTATAPIPAASQQARRQARNARLRAQRLALLDELEATAAHPAAPTDRIDGWLPAPLAEPLQACGLLLLGDLRALIHQGGRWWRALPGVGPIKAHHVAQLVDTLLGTPAPVAWPRPGTAELAERLSGANGSNRAPAVAAGTTATHDHEAIAAWIAARAGSAYTARQYEREAERFLLFCVVERNKALSDAGVEDCRAYMDFLADVPAEWISRRAVARRQSGWAPFKGRLSIASQQVALTIVNALFTWLVQSHYLAANPWTLVNRRLGDDPHASGAAWNDGVVDASRAFTPRAWAALFHYLDRMPPTPAHERLRWMCTFVEATGVRAAELLRARRGDVSHRPSGWILQVVGKGRRVRSVPVPSTAVHATERYFASRGLVFATAPAETPLIAAIQDDTAPGYRSLYESFTRFVRRALKASDLPLAERMHAQRASTHWLRHTHATRAAERDVPADVLQQNLGQRDPRTTARYYTAQIERQQREMERAFGGQ